MIGAVWRWVEVQGEWSAFVGSLLIGRDMVDGGTVVRTEVDAPVVEVG